MGKFKRKFRNFSKNNPGLGDAINFGVNMVASPIEGVTGVNFFDPHMRTKAGQKAEGFQDAQAAFIEKVAPVALNLIAPGAGTALQMGQSVAKGAAGDSVRGFGEERSGSKQRGRVEEARALANQGLGTTMDTTNDESMMVNFASGIGGLAAAAGQFAGPAMGGGNFLMPTPESFAQMDPTGGLPNAGAQQIDLGQGSGIMDSFESFGGNQNAEIMNPYMKFGGPTPGMKKGGCVPKMFGGGPVGPTYEAEGGEVIQGAPPQVYDNTQVNKLAPGMYKVDGASHKNGGAKMSGGDYVYSDSLKLDADFLNDI